MTEGEADNKSESMEVTPSPERPSARELASEKAFNEICNTPSFQRPPEQPVGSPTISSSLEGTGLSSLSIVDGSKKPASSGVSEQPVETKPHASSTTSTTDSRSENKPTPRVGAADVSTSGTVSVNGSSELAPAVAKPSDNGSPSPSHPAGVSDLPPVVSRSGVKSPVEAVLSSVTDPAKVAVDAAKNVATVGGVLHNLLTPENGSSDRSPVSAPKPHETSSEVVKNGHSHVVSSPDNLGPPSERNSSLPLVKPAGHGVFDTAIDTVKAAVSLSNVLTPESGGRVPRSSGSPDNSFQGEPSSLPVARAADAPTLLGLGVGGVLNQLIGQGDRSPVRSSKPASGSPEESGSISDRLPSKPGGDTSPDYKNGPVNSLPPISRRMDDSDNNNASHVKHTVQDYIVKASETVAMAPLNRMADIGTVGFNQAVDQFNRIVKQGEDKKDVHSSGSPTAIERTGDSSVLPIARITETVKNMVDVSARNALENARHGSDTVNDSKSPSPFGLATGMAMGGAFLSQLVKPQSEERREPGNGSPNSIDHQMGTHAVTQMQDQLNKVARFFEDRKESGPHLTPINAVDGVGTNLTKLLKNSEDAGVSRSIPDAKPGSVFDSGRAQFMDQLSKTVRTADDIKDVGSSRLLDNARGVGQQFADQISRGSMNALDKEKIGSQMFDQLTRVGRPADDGKDHTGPVNFNDANKPSLLDQLTRVATRSSIEESAVRKILDTQADRPNLNDQPQRHIVQAADVVALQRNLENAVNARPPGLTSSDLAKETATPRVELPATTIRLVDSVLGLTKGGDSARAGDSSGLVRTAGDTSTTKITEGTQSKTPEMMLARLTEMVGSFRVAETYGRTGDSSATTRGADSMVPGRPGDIASSGAKIPDGTIRLGDTVNGVKSAETVVGKNGEIITTGRPGEVPGVRMGDLTIVASKATEGPVVRPGESPVAGRIGEAIPGAKPGEVTPGVKPSDVVLTVGAKNEIAVGAKGIDVPAARPGDVAGSRPGDVAGAKPGDVAGVRPGDVAGARPGDVAGAKPGDVAGVRPGDVAGARPGEIAGTGRNIDVPVGKPGDPTTAGTKDGGARVPVVVDLTATGQPTSPGDKPSVMLNDPKVKEVPVTETTKVPNSSQQPILNGEKPVVLTGKKDDGKLEESDGELDPQTKTRGPNPILVGGSNQPANQNNGQSNNSNNEEPAGNAPPQPINLPNLQITGVDPNSSNSDEKPKIIFRRRTFNASRGVGGEYEKATNRTFAWKRTAPVTVSELKSRDDDAQQTGEPAAVESSSVDSTLERLSKRYPDLFLKRKLSLQSK